MGADYRETVVAFINSHGPAVPMQIGKHMGMNSMLAGAMLSELSGKGILKISKLKVGGSPVYYVPGQESLLVKFIEYLPDKDRQTVQLLERENVLRENQLTPLLRASLHNIPDFAIPLDVSFNQQKETFWKWHLVSDEETSERIKIILQPPRPEPKPEPLKARPEPRPRPVQRQEPVEHPVPIAEQTHLVESDEPISVILPGQAPHNPGDPATDDFLASLLVFFSKNNIKIVEQQCLKKKAEYDFVLRLPSSVGELTYYCKAKAKKKLADTDVSGAFVQGQLRKLPVLLIGTGELAKKAQELVQRDLHGLTFKQLGGEQ
jgi:hypothetical protein